MWKKATLVIAFLCYAVILTTVLLVVRFPIDSFLSYAGERVEQQLPGYSCTIDGVAYQYPLSLGFQGVALTNSAELVDIRVDSLLITFDRKQLGTKALVSFDLYGGSVESVVILQRSSNKIELPVITVSEISLMDVEPLQRRLDRPVSGIFDFSGSFEGQRDELYKGVLAGTAEVTDLQMKLKRPILQADTVNFDRLTAPLIFQDSLLRISDGVASGPAYDGTFSGQIKGAGQWQESELLISGELDPQGQYIKQNQQVARAVALLYNKYGRRALPYSIGGTFRNPEFRFGEDQKTH